MADPDLLAIQRGRIVAPAGCGKTELLARALARHTDPKPILVLTHTNAGVAAMRNRLSRAKVPSGAYRLATIDGWGMRLIGTFPLRSGHDPTILTGRFPDYVGIRRAAAALLAAGHVNDVLQGSYSRLFVDEYQDCSTLQHTLVAWLSEILPTVIVGDPMQAIFGFDPNDRLAQWDVDVCSRFHLAGALVDPWRWTNAGASAIGSSPVVPNWRLAVK